MYCSKCIRYVGLMVNSKFIIILSFFATEIIFGFNSEVYMIAEGGIVHFNVTIRSGKLIRDFVVNFFTSDGDATGRIVGSI